MDRRPFVRGYSNRFDSGRSRRRSHGSRAAAQVVTVAFGARHAVAVTADGTAHAWGSNASGQLGFEEGPSGVLCPWPTPVDLEVGGRRTS